MNRIALYAVLGAVLAGCTARPTGPARGAREPAAARRSAGTPPGERLREYGAAFRCLTARATGDPAAPWAYGQGTVRFPATELAPNGRTLRYTFQGYDDRPALVAVAACEIPATPAAIARMNRKLGVVTEQPDVTIQDVALAPVVATACAPGYIGEYPACYKISTGSTDGGGGTGFGSTGDGDIWGGGGSGGTGGTTSGDPPPPSPGDFMLSDTARNCAALQPDQFGRAFCRSFVPSGERLNRTQNAIARIRGRGMECAYIADQAAALLAVGKLRYFDHQDGDDGGWGDAPNGVLLSTAWVDTFYTVGDAFGRNLDQLVVHEVEHTLGRDHIDGTALDTPHSRSCGGAA